MTWRALRQRTQTDVRSCVALRDKRDLHLLYRKPIPIPEPSAGGVPEANSAKTAEAGAEAEDIKDEDEDPAAETTVKVKAEETAIAVDPTIEVDEAMTTDVPTEEGIEEATVDPVSGDGEVAEVEAESKPEVEDDGWSKSGAAPADQGPESAEAVEPEAGGMDVDRPATPEALPPSNDSAETN